MKNIFKENIDKYGIINLIICVSIPIIIVIIVCGNGNFDSTYTSQEEKTTTTSTTSTTTKTTTNKQCQAYPCPNKAETGSNYCSIHKKGKTKKCAMCGKAIWDDETFCDSCLYSSVINSKSKY